MARPCRMCPLPDPPPQAGEGTEPPCLSHDNAWRGMNVHSQPPAVRTTCPYCGVGCGVLVRPDAIGGASVAGDPDHPANFGRLCSKGAALGETIALDGRLLHPMLRQADGARVRTSWDVALDRVASGIHDTVARHGPQAVAFYLSGQLL